MRAKGKILILLSTCLLIVSSSVLASGDDPAPIAGNTSHITIFPNSPSGRSILISSWEGKPTDSGVPSGPLTPTKQFSGSFQKCAMQGAEELEQALMDDGEAYRKFTTCSSKFKIEIKVIRYKSTRGWDEVPYGAPIEIDNQHLTVPVYCGEVVSNEETPALMYEDIRKVFENSLKNAGSACNAPVVQVAAPTRTTPATNPVQKAAVVAGQQLSPLNNAPAAPQDTKVVNASDLMQRLIEQKLIQAQKQQQSNSEASPPPSAASATSQNP